jgi:hypothetical protein
MVDRALVIVFDSTSSRKVLWEPRLKLWVVVIFSNGLLGEAGNDLDSAPGALPCVGAPDLVRPERRGLDDDGAVGFWP